MENGTQVSELKLNGKLDYSLKSPSILLLLISFHTWTRKASADLRFFFSEEIQKLGMNSSHTHAWVDKQVYKAVAEEGPGTPYEMRGEVRLFAIRLFNFY